MRRRPSAFSASTHQRQVVAGAAADRRVAGADDEQVALDHAVDDRRRRAERGLEPVVPADGSTAAARLTSLAVDAGTSSVRGFSSKSRSLRSSDCTTMPQAARCTPGSVVAAVMSCLSCWSGSRVGAGDGWRGLGAADQANAQSRATGKRVTRLASTSLHCCILNHALACIYFKASIALIASSNAASRRSLPRLARRRGRERRRCRIAPNVTVSVFVVVEPDRHGERRHLQRCAAPSSRT